MKSLFLKIIELPLWATIGSLVMAFISPVLFFILPIIALVVLDYHTGIRASQAEAKDKDVVSSKNFRTKLEFLAYIGIGLITFLIFDHTLVKAGVSELFGFNLQFILTKFYAGLVMLNEVISILENLHRQGGDIAQAVEPLLKLLKIKRSQVQEKMEKDDK